MIGSMFLRGLQLGIGAAAPIGPVNVEIARRSIRCGWHAGVLVGGGAVTIDMIYAVIAIMGVRSARVHPALEVSLAIAGAALLGYLGISSLRHAVRQIREDFPMDASAATRGHYKAGLLMTATNPMTLAFWFGGLSVGGQRSPDAMSLAWLSVGVGVAAWGWALFFSAVMVLAKKAGQRRVLLAADALGGVMLLYFATWGIWRLAVRFLS